jgi:hypothetical protein
MYKPVSGFVTRPGIASLNQPGLRTMSPITYLMGLASVVTVTLALMEPAGSEGLNLLMIAVFWSLHIFPATMVAWVISGWLFNLRIIKNMSPWVLLVIAGAITGLLLVPVSVMLEWLFGILQETAPLSRSPSLSQVDWLNELKDEFLDVPLTTAGIWPVMNAFVIWCVSSMRDTAIDDPPHQTGTPGPSCTSQVQTSSTVRDLPSGAGSERSEEGFAPKQVASKSQTSGLLGRLPTRIGQDIVLLEAQEHYLRVVTSSGEHLLLQGLSHAIAELERSGFDGVQIHRSVWVVWKHVGNVEVRKGAVSVSVSTGASWKISRRRAKTFLIAWQQRKM